MSSKYYIRHMEDLDLIRPQTGDIGYALDLGCGKGMDAKYLASIGYSVTAVDKEKRYDGAVICDIREFDIEAGKYSVIICNNVLPFIKEKKDVEQIIHKIAAGLKKGGAAFITLYGHNSGMKKRCDMSFCDYEEIIDLLKSLPVEIIDRSTGEGYVQNMKSEIIYQHSHRFILRK